MVEKLTLITQIRQVVRAYEGLLEQGSPRREVEERASQAETEKDDAQ